MFGLVGKLALTLLPADFHLAPEQRVDPEEGVAAGTTEESMQTLVFSLGFMEGFLLSRGKICMNLLDASWEQVNL